ncbi:MAG: MFS transporter [Candidatus Heimdallarchaeota archaeon]|nr:MFS transporter [Candidatus Heimdallarchaeota archaeon]MCK4771152.1 MFS transporter [Candidatus Heimdallarchaeota archaeon]
MNSTEISDYKVYGFRWIVLLLFGLVTLINQIIWITFAAITPKAMSFYGKTETIPIFMFSLVFMIVYIPMNIPAALAIDKFGLKWGTGIGVVLTGVFGILRAVSTQYHWVLIFQIGCAIGQPFLLNSFTKVSSNWFGADEKVLATSLGTMFVLLGILLGMFITPFLVPSNDPTVMLYIYGGIALSLMVVYLLFVKDKPPTPANAYSDETKVFETKGTFDLFKHRDFNILLVLFLFGAGAFNAISTVMADLFKSIFNSSIPGFAPDDLFGIFGGIMIIGGIAGAITLSTLSDKYRKRKIFLIINGISGAVLTLFFFIIEKYVTSFIPQYIAHCIIGFLFGFLLLSALPVGLTFAAEITHPLPEETSNGWLMWIGQLGGISLIMIVMFGFENKVFNFIIYAVILAIATIFAFRMKDLDAYELKS